MITEPVKGFRDYTDEDAVKRQEARKIIAGAFERYGFEPAETPIIEYEEFVKGGNEKDSAVSDIFKLEDRGKRELALRYEFTFQLKRLMTNRKLPYRRYEIGEVFRDEPTSTARFRQFTQCDADVVGSTIKDEAEILALASEILQNLGIKFMILVNNRKLLNEILEKEVDSRKKVISKLKETDINEQILREVDKLDKLPEKTIRANLKKLGAENVLKALKKGEAYFSKFPAYKEILELMKYCKFYGVKVSFSPSIVRGLGYYKGNVFEIKAQGVKETLLGGGSYIFDNVPCTGFAFGLERVCALAKIKSEKNKSLIVSLGEDKEAIKLCQKLRKESRSVFVYYGKPTKALEYANSKNIQEVIFIGKEEVAKGKYKIKNMGTGKEEYRNYR